MNRLMVVGVVLLVAVLVVIGWDGGSRVHSDSRLTAANFRKVHVGMTRLEVTNLLGEPTQNHFGGSAGSRMTDSSRYLYWSDGFKEVTVHFNAEGRVFSNPAKGSRRRRARDGRSSCRCSRRLANFYPSARQFLTEG